jgi:hypothetical protein
MQTCERPLQIRLEENTFEGKPADLANTIVIEKQYTLS